MPTFAGPQPPEPESLELHNGDRMSREEFHRIYERMPADFQAELIGGAICFSCLRAGPLRIVHLPGEPFVEFQLAAQELAPDLFVAVAGYGDVGPGYLPLEKSFAEGGYEPTWAFAAPESEKLIRETLEKLVGT